MNDIYNNPTIMLFIGYFTCIVSDALFAIVSCFVERGLLARARRLGRLTSLEGEKLKDMEGNNYRVLIYRK